MPSRSSRYGQLTRGNLFDTNIKATAIDEDIFTDQEVITSPASGDYTYSGSGFITSLEMSGGTEDAPTYSVSIEGTDALTQNSI